MRDLIRDIKVCISLEDPQIAYNLFRYCFSYPKLVHILRTVPPHISSEALKPLALEYRCLIENLLGSNISDQAYLQASFGLKVGASAGYIAFVNKCASFFEGLIRSQGAIDVFWHIRLKIVLNYLIQLFFQMTKSHIAF